MHGFMVVLGWGQGLSRPLTLALFKSQLYFYSVNFLMKCQEIIFGVGNLLKGHQISLVYSLT